MEKPFLHDNIRKGCYRCLFVVLLLISQQFGLFAQEQSSASSSKLNFGFRVGATISSFTNQQPHNNITSGFSGGAFVAYPLNENMGVQAEVFFTQEGGRLLTFDYPSLVGKDFWYALDAENQKLVLNNISVPILYNYNLAFSNFKLGAFIGPDLGYTVSASVMKEGTVFTESGSFHTYTGSEDVSSNIEKFHVAATAGIGLKIPAGNLNLLLDVRYKYGLTSVYKSYSYVGIPQIAGDLKFNTLSVTCGISF